MSASARDPPSATSGAERAVESNTQDAAVAPSHALVLAQSAARPAAVTAETSRALAAPLAQSVARSRISSAPTLLPSRLAQLVTALSLAARVSLRASGLFIEAILETLRHGTVTGLGVTRRALIAAVGSARALHYVKNGLDWSGRDEEGNRIEDAFLQILDKYANLGIYLIHHTFTLAELFTMSGFYLMLNTIQTGFHAAEESVRLLDSILGSNESSRALSSIITLVRTEFTREDPRFRPTGLLLEQEGDDDEKRRKSGTLGGLAALTKALTAFACLQMATHRRTLRELKQRVVYDCTVVIDSRDDTSSSREENHAQAQENERGPTPPLLRSPLLDPTPESAGRYAGPPNPPRHRTAPTLTPLTTVTGSSSKAPEAVPLGQTGRHRHGSSLSISSLAHDYPAHVLTDFRSELESRIATARTRSRSSTAPSSPTHSRRTSVAFDIVGLGLGGSTSPRRARVSTLGSVHDPDQDHMSPDDIFDQRSETEITRDLALLCGSPLDATERTASLPDAQNLRARHPSHDPSAEFECDSCDVSSDATTQTWGDVEAEEGDLPPEVMQLLEALERQYSAGDGSSSSERPVPGAPAAGQPRRAGTHLLLSPTGQQSYEVEVEETRTTTTTTIRIFEDFGESQIVSRSTRYRRIPSEWNGDRVEGECQGEKHQSTQGDGESSLTQGVGDWVEIATSAGDAVPLGGPDTATSDRFQPSLPSFPNGQRTTPRPASTSDASNHRPLQLVLSSMTKKLTQRRRTFTRVPSSMSVRTARAAQERAQSGPSLSGFSSGLDDPQTLPADPKSTSSSPKASVPHSPISTKAKPVLRALANSFKSRKGVERPASTPVSPTTSSHDFSTLPRLDEKAPSTCANVAPARSTAVQPPCLSTLWDEDYRMDRTIPTLSRTHSVTTSANRASRASEAAREVDMARPPAVPQAEQPRRPRHSASKQTMRSTMTTTCHEASLPTGVPEPRSGNFPHQHLVSNLQHFARYSSAAYGQSFLRIFGIAKHEFKFPHTEIHANNHAFAHHVGIHVEDILLSSFTDPGPTFATDEVSQIINYVAVDHSVKAVVLACRGSLGLADILTDLTCSYEPIPIPNGNPHGTYVVHSGMYCSSTNLQRGVVHDVIAEALAKYPDYGLVLCGHSLGGGVASLLSILWSCPAAAFLCEMADSASEESTYPPISTPFVTSTASGLPAGRPISCYTYGVPCVASPDLVAYCRGLVTSTVHNYDVVPTLSLGVLRDFKSMATGFYAEQGVCEEIVRRVVGVYKHRFGTSAGSAAKSNGTQSGPDDHGPTGAPTDPPGESRFVAMSGDELLAGRGNNKALEPTYQDPDMTGQDLITTDTELSNWLWSLRTTVRAGSDNDKLYPPGNVYIVENYGVFVSAGESDSSAQYTRREGRRVLLRAIDDVERRFSEPVFSRTMLSDHSPAAYESNCDLLAAAVV